MPTGRPLLRQLPNGTWTRCHFTEEINPAEWQPSEDLSLPMLAQNSTQTEEAILELKTSKNIMKSRAVRSVMSSVWEKSVM